MARTRADVAPDVKRDAIIEVATRLFSESGYDGTSMPALARDADVTVNTVYWYFENKDGLLVAASNSFDHVGKIVTAVHARAQVSELVSSWHLEYHEQAERLLVRQARLHLERQGLADLPDSSLRPLARLWVYALDGIITHGVAQTERRELCDEMVAQLERKARLA